ncbi:uncharacterized protein LOC128247922 [Octopus bimaculoides]|uniref:uncharacterized protein LOC128247922 n=1 Tax=Octopus bimaculoides TaxID=37653 RepID=UPI0022E6384F|nr:uncharacterized protein LOC128247922 [Octopus bimaculoides]
MISVGQLMMEMSVQAVLIESSILVAVISVTSEYSLSLLKCSSASLSYISQEIRQISFPLSDEAGPQDLLRKLHGQQSINLYNNVIGNKTQYGLSKTWYGSLVVHLDNIVHHQDRINT